MTMENNKKEVETREVIVHDLTKARTFELKGEAGFKIKSLKQKVSDVQFQTGETSITATATTFRLATELGSIQIIIPTIGKWMMSYPDTFEFEADEPGVAEMKVLISRQPPVEKREKRPRIRKDDKPYEKSYRHRDERPIDSLRPVSGRKPYND